MTPQNEHPDSPDDATEDAEPAAGTDVSQADDEPTVASTGRRSRLTAVLGIAVLVLAVLLALTFVDRGRVKDDLERTDDIAAVASEFGEVLYSYDYRDVEAQLRRIEDLTTPTYAVEYKDDFEANLRAQIVERQVVSTAEVHEVLVNQSTGDQAQAIVITTTTVEGPNESSGTISTLVQLSMLRVDGDWRVDKVLTIANQGTVTDSEGNPVSPDQTPPTEGEGSAGSSTSVAPVPDQSVEEPTEDGE